MGSEASPRGAEGEEGEYCLRLMLSDWKVVTPSASVARPSFLWGGSWAYWNCHVSLYRYRNYAGGGDVGSGSRGSGRGGGIILPVIDAFRLEGG